MDGAVLGIIAFLCSIGTGVLWFRRIGAVAIPENRTPFVIAMATGAVLGIAALSLGAGAIGGTAAVVAIAAGGLFLLTVLIGDQKGGSGALVVGESIPNFTAPDENDAPFELASLLGRPLLLKFFRGHW
jgi:hypothetical protein